jgi:hypothetical protein
MLRLQAHAAAACSLRQAAEWKCSWELEGRDVCPMLAVLRGFPGRLRLRTDSERPCRGNQGRTRSTIRPCALPLWVIYAGRRLEVSTAVSVPSVLHACPSIPPSHVEPLVGLGCSSPLRSPIAMNGLSELGTPLAIVLSSRNLTLGKAVVISG